MKVALFRSATGRFTTVCDDALARMMPDYVRITEWAEVNFKPRGDILLCSEVQDLISEMEARDRG